MYQRATAKSGWLFYRCKNIIHLCKIIESITRDTRFNCLRKTKSMPFALILCAQCFAHLAISHLVQFRRGLMLFPSHLMNENSISHHYCRFKWNFMRLNWAFARNNLITFYLSMGIHKCDLRNSQKVIEEAMAFLVIYKKKSTTGLYQQTKIAHKRHTKMTLDMIPIW